MHSCIHNFAHICVQTVFKISIKTMSGLETNLPGFTFFCIILCMAEISL